MIKNRQIEMLIYLLQHKKTTQQVLADHFEVSRKTIERDIDRLSSVGIPIHCQQGVGGGIVLDESYKFNHSFFTNDDIGYIVIALHIAKTFSANPQNQEVYQKLALMNPEITKFFSENINKHFFLDLYAPPVDFEEGIFLQINKCLDLKLLATIDDVPDVVPLCYVYKLDGIHLFCHKEGYKLLKIAEISSFIPSDVEIEGEFLSYNEYQQKYKQIF